MSFATNKVTIIRTHQGCSSSGGQRTVTVTKTVTCNNGQRTVTTSSTTTGGSVCNNSQLVSRTAPSLVQPAVACKASPTTVQPSSRNAGTTSSSTATFENAVLAEHNRLRAKHSAAPLTLSADMSRYAQEWANHLAARNVLQHRSNNRYGENLYASFGRTSISGEDAVRSWYSEIKDYTFGQANPGNFSQVGHFTQLVWKDSRQLGVGMARNGNNIYVVCNYDPPGNFAGRYPTNVTRN